MIHRRGIRDKADAKKKHLALVLALFLVLNLDFISGSN